jgi:hypothetical protein
MADQARRPTMIALRARRQAYQIASDILYEEPLALRTVHCFRCEAHYNVTVANVADYSCAQCGAPLDLSTHVKPPLARYAEWVPLDLPDRPDERLVAEIERELDNTVGYDVLCFALFMFIVCVLTLSTVL